MLLLLADARAQDCPDRIERLDLLDAAERALVEADLPTADEKLRALEAAYSCGSIAEPEMLGRMWLIEGAWLSLQADEEAAGDSWRAAARIAPGRWVEDFGTRLRASYETANRSPAAGTSTITLDPPLFQWIGAVDGTLVDFPATVPAGLHLVQVGPDPDHVVFSRILLAFPDTPSVVVTGVVEPTGGRPPPQPDPEAPAPAPDEPKEPRNPGRVALHAAVGADAVIGRPGENPAGTEPGFKLVAPVETGVVVRPTAKTWVRAAASASPLVGGRFVYEDRYGPTATPSALGAHLAGGFAAVQGDMGALLGLQWPGRFAVRAVLAGALGRTPLKLEGRVGLNAASGGPPEPAFGVQLAFVPRVVDLPEPEPDAD